ncbi:DUF1769-domain-containing protein [Piedraia hortae CBS 480.64]|uniref:DUF1769-domain-containing protein n=1 Tax=Piedraia hortae CBS 480.64 TaxID=1314780 RepID=A0A6A7C828_9PEZI|nr:DUF1769-domain-containing protein [Piedraia hortae CBS 480.64]
MANKYLLSITGGPSYTEQTPLPVNSEKFTKITSPKISANVVVRVQNFRGLSTDGKSQSTLKTSPYFSTTPHEGDLYSIQFSFVLKDDSINGNDLVFGNDFDHPIRDKLPPGFQQAFNLVKWFVDPGLYGDVQADEPYLYGPLLSSMNVLSIGPWESEQDEDSSKEVKNLEEGSSGSGSAARSKLSLPDTSAARKKHFLVESNLKEFTFEKGRVYHNDFFNPYLDFNEFALKLPKFSLVPGITIPIISYWDGQPLR